MIWLSALSDGQFSRPETNPEANELYTYTSVARKLHVSKAAVFEWRKKLNEIMSVDNSNKKVGRMSRLASGNYPEIEEELYVYMMERIF